jgi:CDP-6-deoxy-D-xylo-4-hexulose-3-dehydrase
MKITLTSNSIPNADMDAAAEWLKTYPRLSSGPLVAEFEKGLAEKIGSKHAVFVNSGSTANMLMLYALKVMGKMRNDRVVVPALAWATTLSPVIQFGMTPILCDINMDDLSVDLVELEKIFKESSPSALILVSVLGMMPDYTSICELCKKYGVHLLEDACESLGSWKSGYAGTFGCMGTYSFFYSHQLCCVEGGAVVTDDEETYQTLLMLREHGWARKCSPEKSKELKDEWGISDFNDMYTFYVPGFNFRNTEINAFFGLRQLKRFDEIAEKRNKNFKLLNEQIKNKFWKPKKPASWTVTSNLGYPVITPNKDKVVQALIKGGVECRPLISGSMGKQPMYVKEYGSKEMKNCSILDAHGIYIPNNPELTAADIEYMATIINKFTK